MKGNESLVILFLVALLFVVFLWQPQIKNWWVRRQRIKEARLEREMNRKLDERDR